MPGGARKILGPASIALLALGMLVAVPAVAHAAQTDTAPVGVSEETQFVLNTFALLVWGALVMWMGAGFTMLESGSVRTKNASMICLKNIGLYSIAGIAYFVIGYNLMHLDVDGGALGTFRLFHGPSDAEMAMLDGSDAAVAAVIQNGRSSMSFWFYQMVFVATCASIVSGAIAERVKLWAFFAFTLILTGLIYPVVGAWAWGGGWLAEMGFQDFAGSAVVHSTGGWAALAGVIIIGPRLGKFRRNGTVKSTPPSNVLLVTLGVLILWFGWFGFNGGSQLALGSAFDATAMSGILVNTNLAGAAGLIVAVIVARPIFGRMDFGAVLNGGLAGLVSITAGPEITDHRLALAIGAVGGLLSPLATWLLEKVKIDDVVGAVPVHLVGGIWGTLAASIAAGADLNTQAVGVVSIGVFAFVSSLVVWKALDLIMGVRVSSEIEEVGQDVGELGIESLPEFVLMPDDFDDV